jgi:hypothetical protein
MRRFPRAKEINMLRSRRVLAAVMAAAASVGLAIPATASAATTSYSGTLLLHGPLPFFRDSRPTFPCSGPGICGDGKLQGLGDVQITIDDEQFTAIPGTDCLSDQRSETIDVLDGSGTIALDSSGTICPPGASQSGPHFNSYGNPLFFELTSTVDGADSTGAYAGATGSGTENFQFAGATGVWRLSGAVTT